MIKRSIPKKLIPVENLTEDLTVGAGGIDVTSPPTKQNTVYDMENLNVDLDGGVSLRKPLFFNSSSSSARDTVRVDYIFNDAKIELTTNKSVPSYYNLQNFSDVKTLALVENLEDDTDVILAKDVYYKEHFPIYINNTGISVVSDKGDTIPLSAIRMDNLNKLNIINTNTSTIILGVKFNLNIPELKHYAKQYDLGVECYRYRPIKITKDDYGVYKAEIMQIETATLYTGEGNVTRASFNIMDDYTYSFKDNYDAGYAYTKGILKYTPANIDRDINTYTVEDLTESDKFKLVDSITKDEFDKVYLLKALVTNTAVDNEHFKIYCTWEKSYDNVTWMPVQEFLNKFKGNLISFEVEDTSKSYETVDKSYNYVRNVFCTPFLNKDSSNQDFIGNRPDVLILDELDSATYRFSIRSIVSSAEDLDTKIRTDYCKYSIVSGVSKTDSRYYINVPDTNLAKIKFNFHFEINGDDTSLLSNIRLIARSVFSGNGEQWYSYKNSFGEGDLASLSDETLDLVFGNLELHWTTSENSIITCDTEIELEIRFHQNWTSQLLCLKFFLYNAASPSSDPGILWSDTFSCPIGRDLSDVLPAQNPVFKYCYGDDTRGTADVNFLGSDENHPECFKYDFPVFSVGTPDYGPIVPGNPNWSYMDRDNVITLELVINLHDTQKKTKLPLEMLNYLNHPEDATDSYKMYIFNKYAYYFRNANVYFNVNLWTTVWAKYSNKGLNRDTYSAFADLEAIMADVEMPLYDFLNLKNNLQPLRNAMKRVYDNAIVTGHDINGRGPISYKIDYTRHQVMDDATYNKIKTFYENSVTPIDWHFGQNYLKVYGAPLPGRLAEYCILKVMDMIDNNQITSNNINIFHVYMLPYADDLNWLDSNSSVELYTGNAFTYDNNSWNYGYIPEAVHITSNALDESTCTPESYISSSGAKYFLPFNYLHYYNLESDTNTFIRLDSTYSLNTLGTYDIFKLTDMDSTYVYNKPDEVFVNPAYAELENIPSYAITRYSLLLAEAPDTILVTKNKQIEDYTTISAYENNTIYYNYRIWYYGKNLKNNIYFSNADSLVTPIDNCITLSTDTDDYVTSLVPWRDYLIATTFKNIYLISKYNDSYVFKQINTFIGVPEVDANTCKAILNGIVFKSGTAIYALHPNTYSSDDTILNITDISKPISHHLIKGVNNFAISTEYYYYVFIPREEDTLVFKYEYTRKIWSKFVYPIVLHKAKLFNVGDIIVLDNNNNVYDFDKTLEWYEEKLKTDYLRYGDYLSPYIEEVKPIAFMLDTGQKSSAMQYTKQFTESKFIIATMEMKDTFPIENTIYVDGVNLIASHRYISNELQLITTDPNTDGAFSRTNPEDIGYLNTNIINDNGETFNVIRQMILRYMGKGKTIRHVLKGESTFNFKIYVLYYRYRIPHNKQ